ncbi:MAG TPA: hypothetical protein DDZ96_12160 [Porphyromonadaceae bacterium]|jgi:hypothetical protein|nr:hypothetical protein [Porphyromonadaceae bacterium]HBL34552.1 hypothetical protein [Porphyromonadaceae bacterium]HBX19390.1 hypothetical protein [Porphyromonadaceae bacterium]HCM21558.1 hypothetical protein [Porphyromonadaceae bacterium]
MKKILLISALLISVWAVKADNRDQQIAFAQLPKSAQTFVEKHFSKDNISVIFKDIDRTSVSYEVYFKDGGEVEFSSNGDWKDIDCKRSQFPQSILPAKIYSFLTRNHSDLRIITVEKKKSGYEIEMNNDLEVKFDRSGNFLRYED